MSSLPYGDFDSIESDLLPRFQQGLVSEDKDRYSDNAQNLLFGSVSDREQVVFRGHCRDSSATSISTNYTSLVSLEQISKMPTSMSNFQRVYITPPEESKRQFNRILFEDSDDDDDSVSVNEWWDNPLQTGIVLTKNDSLFAFTEGLDDEIYGAPTGIPHVAEAHSSSSASSRASSVQPIGLGITFGNRFTATSEVEDDTDHESEPDQKPIFVVTLKFRKEFYENVAERNKRVAYRGRPLSREITVESDPIIKRKNRGTSNQVTASRLPIARQAKTKAIQTLHKEKEDSPSKGNSRRARRRRPKAHPMNINGTSYNTYTFNPVTHEFDCLFCGTSFRRLEHLKRHFKSLHSDDRPYACHLCEKAFARSDNLAQHLRVHAKSIIAETGVRKHYSR